MFATLTRRLSAWPHARDRYTAAAAAADDRWSRLAGTRAATGRAELLFDLAQSYWTMSGEYPAAYPGRIEAWADDLADVGNVLELLGNVEQCIADRVIYQPAGDNDLERHGDVVAVLIALTGRLRLAARMEGLAELHEALRRAGVGDYALDHVADLPAPGMSGWRPANESAGRRRRGASAHGLTPGATKRFTG